MTAEFRLLGAVEARIDGQAVSLGPARQRCVLAALLADVNHVVSVDHLVDRVWGGHPPHDVRGTLHSYLSRLRRALAGTDDVRIAHQSGGYRVTAEESTIDVHRFRRLIVDARAADPDQAAGLLQEALDLWHGEALTGVDSPWTATLRHGLARQRETAEMDHADALLGCGRHTELVAPLSVQATARPLDERLAGQLMLALYRAGRPAEALRHYQRVRGQLAEELGADPGLKLQDLHQRILRADRGLTVTRRVSEVPHAPPPVTPHQLPAPPAWFTGRAAELVELTRGLRAGDGRPVLICAVGGSGGIGKTALALHWAHHNVADFPDGQLFVNLRGFDPSGRPMAPSTALRGFLDALGVNAHAIPTDLDAKAALYRSLVRGQRILIMLDNARDSAQLDPLLPGGSSCAVLITSRDRLSGLVATRGVQPVPVDILSPDESRRLLATRLGAARLAAEPDVTEDLLTQCGGFPLALNIVAGRATAKPGFPLATLATELGDETTRLDDIDPRANLTAVLSWSHAALPTEHAEVFHLVGLAPGRDISRFATAALTGLSSGQAHAALDALEQCSLLQQDTPGRYRMHDMIRRYAVEHVSKRCEPDSHVPALTRLAEFYLHHTSAAAHTIAAQTPVRNGPSGTTLATTATFNYQQASVWLDTERTNLLALAQHFAAHRQVAELGELCSALRHYFDLCGHYDESYILHTLACDAARVAGEHCRGVEGHAHIGLGLVHWRRGNYAQAAEHVRQALGVAHETADVDLAGHALHHLASSYARLGHYHQARGYFRRGLALAQHTGNHDLEAQDLDGIGFVTWRLGEYERALVAAERGLLLGRRTGNRYIKSHSHIVLGLIHWKLQHQDQTFHHFQQALDIAHDTGNRWIEGNALSGLGLACRQWRRHDDAHTRFLEALHVARDTGNRSLEAESLNNVGELARSNHEPLVAIDYHQQALTLTEQTGERSEEAAAHNNLASVHHILAHYQDAHQHWRKALTLYTELGVPETREIANRLQSLSPHIGDSPSRRVGR